MDSPESDMTSTLTPDGSTFHAGKELAYGENAHGFFPATTHSALTVTGMPDSAVPKRLFYPLACTLSRQYQLFRKRYGRPFVPRIQGLSEHLP